MKLNTILAQFLANINLSNLEKLEESVSLTQEDLLTEIEAKLNAIKAAEGE